MKSLLLLCFLAFALRRLMTYLHIYQQEEYQPVRFLRWLWNSRSFDMKASLVILIAGGLEYFIRLAPGIAEACVAVTFAVIAVLEKDPRKASKKRLSMTGRATRIYWVAFVLIAAIAVLYSLPDVPVIAWLLPVHVIPLTLALANLLLTPYEKSVQRKFWEEAHGKLKSLRPTVIGITGSYGKTSTKHLLGHILEVQAATLITPGSVNTPMGIARVVREQLGPHHRFFICEMGAYGPGSIARLCRLAPPDAGAITSIGMAHYERFKSLETVAETKFELAQAVAKTGGHVIVHQQAMSFAAAQTFQQQHAANLQIVGDDAIASAQILQTSQTLEGIAADVLWRGETYRLRAPIFGEHHIGNMVVAFATACSLGVSPQDAVLALASTPQISHRLEVKAGIGQAQTIDDAYNSNPVGFSSALRLLDLLNVSGGRRILVTPGMVELGTAHDAEHRIIGELAAETVDVLLAVVPARITTLTEGFRNAKPDGIIVPCVNFAAAREWMEANIRKEDVVLMENDLPDLYEKKLRL